MFVNKLRKPQYFIPKVKKHFKEELKHKATLNEINEKNVNLEFYTSGHHSSRIYVKQDEFYLKIIIFPKANRKISPSPSHVIYMIYILK